MANVIDAYIPEIWAQVGLAILEENMVIGNLVYRDYTNEIASFGNVVHTRKPADFKSYRKTGSDQVIPQDATATEVEVKLDQLFHTSFIITDDDASKSFQDLAKIFLRPAAIAMARSIDRVLSGQAIRFLPYVAGSLGSLSGSNAGDYLVDTRKVLNVNKAPQNLGERHMVLTSVAEAAMLKDPAFTEAYRVGDDGTALREASLGRKFGFNMFSAQNQPYIAAGNTVSTGTTNGGIAAGATTLPVTYSGAISVGSWFTIEGDMTPMQVKSTGGSTTSIVPVWPLTYPVLTGKAVTVYTPGAVDQSSSSVSWGATGYPAGYSKEITIDGFTVAPQIGQPVTFGHTDATTNKYVYSIIDVTGETGITLDRPLEVGIANDDEVNIGPAGSYNFGFHTNALGLICRPLALPRPGIGAAASVMDYNNISMRVTLTYQGLLQGTLVTLDLLAGVAVLEKRDGCLMLG